MGKITVKDAEALQTSGILSEAAVTELQSKGFVSKERNSVKFTFKTPENKLVEPCLYFRNAKGTTKSKKMQSFITEYNSLLEKYATTTNNKTK
jgi:hypothetical protein|tara:strand:- start:130 stop:408 length:279 start_codon:yes stop_codon:yes gene_type:complete